MTTRTDVPAEVKKRMAEIAAGRWPTEPKPITTLAPPKGK